jgi:hypothetical protein
VNDYLGSIFGADSTDEVCYALQAAIASLKSNNYFSKVPDCYQELTASSPDDVQEWFDEMRDDEQAEEEGNLREIFGLYDAALRRLRELGFHRE